MDHDLGLWVQVRVFDPGGRGVQETSDVVKV